ADDGGRRPDRVHAGRAGAADPVGQHREQRPADGDQLQAGRRAAVHHPAVGGAGPDQAAHDLDRVGRQRVRPAADAGGPPVTTAAAEPDHRQPGGRDGRHDPRPRHAGDQRAADDPGDHAGEQDPRARRLAGRRPHVQEPPEPAATDRPVLLPDADDFGGRRRRARRPGRPGVRARAGGV
ncbi:MAG: hypothetical protein AVDCRST_MAG64-2361, partial [uncultured Phycisphaerae bacterium]